MIFVVEALCVVFGIGLTGFALLWFTRWWRSQRVLRQRYSDQFFDLAGELVHDDRLDDGRLEALRTLAAMALDRAAYGVLRAIVRAIEDGSAPRRPIGVPHPDIAQNWHSLVYAWTMAVSFQRIYGGIFLRDRLVRALNPQFQQRTEAALETDLPRALAAA